jgi:hypothetical protein
MGRHRVHPGTWIPRLDSWRCCVGVTGVREVREPLVVWNCRGGATHRRRHLGRNPDACEVETEQGGLGV